MKIHFKQQPFQVQAVQAIVDCFDGQPIRTKEYTLDRTQEILKRSRELSKGIQQGILYEEKLLESIGYRNSPFLLSDSQILSNIPKVQRKYRWQD